MHQWLHNIRQHQLTTIGQEPAPTGRWYPKTDAHTSDDNRFSPTTTASSWLMQPSAWPCSCSTCGGTINGSYQPMGVAPLTAFPWAQTSPSHTPVTYYDGLSNPEIPPDPSSTLSSPKDVLGEYNKDWNWPSIEP